MHRLCTIAGKIKFIFHCLLNYLCFQYDELVVSKALKIVQNFLRLMYVMVVVKLVRAAQEAAAAPRNEPLLRLRCVTAKAVNEEYSPESLSFREPDSPAHSHFVAAGVMRPKNPLGALRFLLSLEERF